MKQSNSNERPAGAATNPSLNENHLRHVVTTFRYMDDLLAKAEHIMGTTGSPSPFQEYFDDTTPLQRKVTHEFVVRVREIMRRHMEELNIPRPAPTSGASWGARNAVAFAKIALAEIEPTRMSGYGKLADDAAERINAISDEMSVVLDSLDNYLAQNGRAAVEKAGE